MAGSRSSYLSGVAGRRRTSQSEAIPGRESDMKQNAAGGFVFEIGTLERLRRFLILGSEGGSYYAGEKELTKDNIAALSKAFDELGSAAVNEIVEISVAGRAAKNDVAIYAIALACAHKNEDVKRAALDAIPQVCRTATHLFMFLNFVEEHRGWGRALKKAVARWYVRDGGAPLVEVAQRAATEERSRRDPAQKVAYQAVKYRQREGWTHRDVLRLVKPGSEVGTKPNGTEDTLFKWITGRQGESISLAEAVAQREDAGRNAVNDDALRVIEAFQRAQAAETPADTVRLIEQYGGLLPREALKTDHLKDKGVNEALVRAGMPQFALLRNLANMTRYGVIEPMGDLTQFVVGQLTDAERVKRARIHPVNVLNALLTYKSGIGQRGVTWRPVGDIVDALDEMFYLAFDAVEPTGKRHMFALDVSGSMWGRGVAGYGSSYGGGFPNCRGMDKLPPRLGAAAMMMASARVGDPYMVTAFSSGYMSRGTWQRTSVEPGDGLLEVPLTKRMRLDSVIEETEKFYPGGTDCALPMLHALRNEIVIDTFVVYTDNETWAGTIHPVQALDQYRREVNAQAKLAVVGMTATKFSIADPLDAGMLDVVGFDSAAPALLGDFSAGRV